jgi:hypothetical protein
LTSPQSSPTSARSASKDGIVGVVSASVISAILPDGATHSEFTDLLRRLCGGRAHGGFGGYAAITCL